MKASTSTLLAISALAALVACSEKKTPAPKHGAASPAVAPGATPGATPGVTPGTSPGTTPDSFAVALEDPSAALRFEAGKPLRVLYKITGSEGKELAVGLFELPPGAKVTRDASQVTVAWESPTAGKHGLKVIVRDKKACEAATSDAAKCDIKEADWGKTAKESYDIVSAKATLDVTTGGTSPSTPSPTPAPGTTPGGGNGDLISQILGQLGGAGGPDLQNTLSGLSGGQLQQVLALLQGSGGNLDINSILALVTGFALQNQQGAPGGVAGPVPGVKPTPN